jgi:hypothetical protein
MNTQTVLDELVQELAREIEKVDTIKVIDGIEYGNGIEFAFNKALELVLTKKQQAQNLEDYHNKSLDLINSLFTVKNTI